MRDSRVYHINRDQRVKDYRKTESVSKRLKKKCHTVLFALKLHNHKSREMNIIQMSSDEILMYVMSYIRCECVFFSSSYSSSWSRIHRLFVCDRVWSHFKCIRAHIRWKWQKKERKKEKKNEMNVLRMHISTALAIFPFSLE